MRLRSTSIMRRAALTACVVATVACAASGPAFAEDATRSPVPQDFAYGMKFETTGRVAAYRSALPADVYRGVVRPDLADMAVFNGRGEVVPHVLQLPRRHSALTRAPVALPVFPIHGNDSKAMEAVRVTIETAGAKIHVDAPAASASPGSLGASGSTVAFGTTSGPGVPGRPIVSYVLDGRALETAIAGMVIGWPENAADFAGRLKVEGSDDLAYWQTLVEGAPIANLSAGESRLVERRIETRLTRSRFWRLSWVGEQAPFEITSVTAEPADDWREIGRPSLVFEGVAVAGKPGEFEFDIGSQLPVDRVNVELPEVNSVAEVELLARAGPKSAWLPVTRRGFYRLQSAIGDLVNGEVSIAPTSDRYWLARVDLRGNGLGSGKPKLRIAWPPHEVVFLARGGGPYTLAFGSASTTASMGRIPALPTGAAVLYAPLGKQETLGGESRRTVTADTFPTKSTVLWAVLALGVALLAYMALHLGRELKR